jgi:hypothetical protein
MEKHDLLPRVIRALFWAAIVVVSLFAIVVVLILAIPVVGAWSIWHFACRLCCDSDSEFRSQPSVSKR